MMRPPHILLVEAPFYPHITQALRRGAERALAAAGATFEAVSVTGAFEVPAAIAFAARASGRFDGFVALACVIRGETTHYDYVCAESARALMDLACREKIALGYGILTVENGKQAWARAGVADKNKGGDAARACLAMIALRRRFALPAR